MFMCVVNLKSVKKLDLTWKQSFLILYEGIMVSVSNISVIMLIANLISVIIMSVFILSVIMMRAIMLSVIMVGVALK
jgi:hypothetical protein